MYLPKLLSAELIRLNVEATDKWTLIDQLTGLVMNSAPLKGHPTLDRTTVRQAIVAREHERTTAIGHGCALPHARIAGLEAPAACLVTLARPLDFQAPDNAPVSLVCLLLVPQEHPSLTLKVMAELASLLSDAPARQALEKAVDPMAVYKLLCLHDKGAEYPVVAGSIMRSSLVTIYPDTPLTEVTRLLQIHNLDAASVVERDGTLVGEITCDRLCGMGLPEFFSQLRSVAFIKNFDPFENYFKTLKTAVARDVMSTDFAALPESATLLEVIFELTVHKHAKVYVVRDGKRIGVIDRSAVISRIMNF